MTADEPDMTDSLERRLDIVVSRGAPTPGRAFLLGVSGEAAGKLYPLSKQELLVGRSPSADVRIKEKAVSHVHAQLRMENGECLIRDLESTNGTFVNGEMIAGVMRLNGGDTIGVGSTTFTYLAASEANSDALAERHESTVELYPGGNSGPSFIDAVRVRPSLPPLGHVVARAGSQYPGMALGHEEDEASFTDVIHKIRAYWVYVQRYGWLVLTCTCFGVGAGVIQAKLKPPPGSAWFEMTLSPDAGSAGGDSSEGVQAFRSPESTFRSLPLIRRTMSKLGAPNATLDQATAVQAQLKLERADYNSPLWRGGFGDVTAEQAAEFLSQHLNSYLDSEIEKVLGTIRAEAAFWQEKTEEAHRELSTREAELLQFQQAHPEVLPRQENQDPVAEAKKDATSLSGRLRDVDAELSRLRGRLSEGTSIRARQLQKAQHYRDLARAANDKIVALKAQGLGELHPQIKQLQAEQAAHEAKAREVEVSGASDIEVAVDAETLTLKEQVARLEGERGRLTASVERAEDRIRAASHESLPELRQRYAELVRRVDEAKTNHAQASKNLEGKQLQLDREKAGVRAHYEIIQPPTPEPASVSKARIKRAAVGGIIGLLLATFAALVLEVRARWTTFRRV